VDVSLSGAALFIDTRPGGKIFDGSAIVRGNGQLGFGIFVYLLYRSRFRPWSRRVPAAAGFVLAASGVSAVTFLDSPGLAISAFAIATFGVEMTISPSWAYCIDIAGRNSGSASAAMNMAGSVGAFASANAFPLLYRVTGNSDAYFWIAAALNALAAVCWLSMDSMQDSHFGERSGSR
jgi:ACS family glucarate transporter-like MFS transporter